MPTPPPSYPRGFMLSRERVSARVNRTSSWGKQYPYRQIGCFPKQRSLCALDLDTNLPAVFATDLSPCLSSCLDPYPRSIVISYHRYDPHGFQLSDGMDVRGSMICMPNSFVLWKPKRPSEITVESLRILELVIPKTGTVDKRGHSRIVLIKNGCATLVRFVEHTHEYSTLTTC